MIDPLWRGPLPAPVGWLRGVPAPLGFAAGVPAGALGVPVRHRHSGAELCDPQDVEGAAAVVARLLRGLRGALPLAGEDLRQILRTGVASALAWWAGRALGAPQPTFAVLAVILSLQGNPFGSLRLAGQRLLGVGGGVVLGVAALRLHGLSAPVIGLVMLVALALGSRLRVQEMVNTQVAISALLLLAVGHGWQYGLARLWETALGGAVATAVSALLWPVDPRRAFQGEVTRLGAALAADLGALAPAFDPARPRAADLGALRARAAEAQRRAGEFPALADALRWNPWRDPGDLRRLQARAETVALLYRHLRTLTRIAADAAGRRPPAVLGPGARADLAAALTHLRGAAGVLVERVGAGRAGDLVAAADAGIAGVAADGPLGAAVASELGHIAADLASAVARPPVGAGGAGRAGPAAGRSS